jgi:hypothetical protein
LRKGAFALLVLGAVAVVGVEEVAMALSTEPLIPSRIAKLNQQLC